MKLKRVDPLTEQWHQYRGTEADGRFDLYEGFIPRTQVLQEIAGKPLSEQKATIHSKYRRPVICVNLKGDPIAYTPERLPEDKGLFPEVVAVHEDVPEEEFEQSYLEAEKALKEESRSQTFEERIAELEQKLKAVTELALKLAQKD